MKVVLFEDERWSRFAPLARMRHVSLLMLGTSTLLDHAKMGLGKRGGDDELALSGRSYLAATTRERTGLEFNDNDDGADGETLLVNGRLMPSAWGLTQKVRAGSRAVSSDGEVVVALLRPAELNQLETEDGVVPRSVLSKLVKDEMLESPAKSLFQFPWELVSENAKSINLADRTTDSSSGESVVPPAGSILKGDRERLWISPEAEVDGNVFFDTRNGPIIIERGVEVEAFTHVTGPCFIGAGTKVHSALIRGGTSIGEVCRIGGEIENSIISPYTNKAHYGFVGNSIVGEWVNLGAGSVFSDLKNTYGTIRVDLPPEGRIDTGVRKLGPTIGDMGKISIGCRIFAGKRTGVSSHTVDLVTTDVPSFVFLGRDNEMVELELNSAIETQRRMMSRRGIEMSWEMEKLIKFVYAATASERMRADVRKGELGA
jgi:UDP-N-acetylglucosamine diphosphorylase/glucosamine-1-phosphate N-acetyltransferase